MTELRLDLGWVAAATRGRLMSGDPSLAVGAVVTDSRTATSGDLFVALQGPRFDGHDFVPAVLANGAAGAVVHRGSISRERQELRREDSAIHLARAGSDVACPQPTNIMGDRRVRSHTQPSRNRVACQPVFGRCHLDGICACRVG